MMFNQVEGRGFWEIDWKRNVVFLVFGAAYLGGFQYWIQVCANLTGIP